MKTTFSRTFFPAAIILLVALILVGGSFRLLAKNFLQSQAMDRLKSNGSVIAQAAATYYTDGTLTDRDFLTSLSVAASISGADAVICDANGSLLMCSDAPLGCKHQGLVINDPVYLRRVLSSDYVQSTGVIQGLYSDPRYVVATPIRDHTTGKSVGFVLISTSMLSSAIVLEKLSDIYLYVSLLVILVAVVVMTIYARSHSVPLRDMARTASAFGHGDFSARVRLRKGSPVEIQELTLSFNNMADSLEKSEYQRKEFVANVSHELKTPMTTIGGYVDGILDGTIPEEKHAYYMQIVSDETKRLNRLVRSMLDISRLQAQGGIPEHLKSRFDVADCAGRVLITFEKKITDKALQVQVQMPEYPVFTEACEDYVTQVIYNLVDNAVKFCSEGGNLSLQIRESQKKLYVSIANDGITIPPEELPLVFDRFHKLDKSRAENRDSWGLGLHIVKTIICSHGENISVSSHNGRTEFTFTLPHVN